MMRRRAGRNQLESRGLGSGFSFCLNCRGKWFVSINKKNTRPLEEKDYERRMDELTDGKRKIIMPRREMGNCAAHLPVFGTVKIIDPPLDVNLET